MMLKWALFGEMHHLSLHLRRAEFIYHLDGGVPPLGFNYLLIGSVPSDSGAVS